MSQTQFEYGFRYDPMHWVENDPSLHAAEVRRLVFETPKPQDKQVFAEQIDAQLSEQQDDGSIGTHPLHPVLITSEALVAVAKLGASAEEPRVKRALDYLVSERGYDRGLESIPASVYDAMSRFDRDDIPGLQGEVSKQIDDAEEWIHLHLQCPWTPVKGLMSLWRNRHLDDRSMATLERGFSNICEPLNAAGCAEYNDPWGYLDAAGSVDLPLGREIVAKQVPMILRSQTPDGGWGEHSVKVLRALTKYGLFEPLREPLPLPADWRIVHEIPIGSVDATGMTWGDGKLWVYDRQANDIVALSSTNGTIERRLKLDVEHGRYIGWRDGDLLLTQQLPTEQGWMSHEKTRRLLTIDAMTGEVQKEELLDGLFEVKGVAQVGDQLVVADGFLNSVAFFDTNLKLERLRVLGAPGSIELTAQDQTLWHTDWLLTEIIFRSDLSGKLLDWGTAPFQGGCAGLAFDGRNLWALDHSGHRVCMIEKTDAGKM
jgi:hypothetical protein|tara:strand:+ start:762 stop:2219 length:1458 start_codon:yes stop_codon:yes gene_type:complete